MNKKLVFAAAAALSMVSIPQAFARCSSGEIANFFCETGVIDQTTANIIDLGHAGLGRPIETRILPIIADSIQPGAGQVLRTWDSMNRGGHNPMPNSGGFVPSQGGFGQPQQMVGNFCLTQMGRAGPGPYQPVGAFCSDVWGNAGYIVR